VGTVGPVGLQAAVQAELSTYLGVWLEFWFS
jgi:nitrate reductase assembly molybdenum cofactor insertion protein NarJ